VSPFWGLEKAAVLQDARCFNDSQLDARRCQQARTQAASKRCHTAATALKLRLAHAHASRARATR